MPKCYRCSQFFIFHLEHSLLEVMAQKKVFVARIQESLKGNRPLQVMAAELGHVESHVLSCGYRHEQFVSSIFIWWVGFVHLCPQETSGVFPRRLATGPLGSTRPGNAETPAWSWVPSPGQGVPSVPVSSYVNDRTHTSYSLPELLE